jgi:hypothetical protein
MIELKRFGGAPHYNQLAPLGQGTRAFNDAILTTLARHVRAPGMCVARCDPSGASTGQSNSDQELQRCGAQAALLLCAEISCARV